MSGKKDSEAKQAEGRRRESISQATNFRHSMHLQRRRIVRDLTSHFVEIHRVVEDQLEISVHVVDAPVRVAILFESPLYYVEATRFGDDLRKNSV